MMLFIKKKKIKEILEANELLRVESKNKKISSRVKYVLVLLVTIGYLLSIQITQDKEVFFVWIVIISIFYLFLLAIIFKFFTGRGSPLIFTEKGISIDPFLAEFWEDLAGYKWETFRGLTRTSLSSEGEGVCLRVVDKSTFQRNVETWTGHTMLAQYGIYFTPEEIKRSEEILAKYNIKKI